MSYPIFLSHRRKTLHTAKSTYFLPRMLKGLGAPSTPTYAMYILRTAIANMANVLATHGAPANWQSAGNTAFSVLPQVKALLGANYQTVLHNLNVCRSLANPFVTPQATAGLKSLVNAIQAILNSTNTFPSAGGGGGTTSHVGDVLPPPPAGQTYTSGGQAGGDVSSLLNGVKTDVQAMAFTVSGLPPYDNTKLTSLAADANGLGSQLAAAVSSYRTVSSQLAELNGMAPTINAPGKIAAFRSLLASVQAALGLSGSSAPPPVNGGGGGSGGSSGGGIPAPLPQPPPTKSNVGDVLPPPPAPPIPPTPPPIDVSTGGGGGGGGVTLMPPNPDDNVGGAFQAPPTQVSQMSDSEKLGVAIGVTAAIGLVGYWLYSAGKHVTRRRA